MITIKFAAHDDACAIGYMAEWRKYLESTFLETEIHFEVSFLSRADVRHCSFCPESNKIPEPKKNTGLERIATTDPSFMI